MTFQVALHDPSDAYVDTVEAPAQPTSETVIEHEGRVYVYHQRSGHYREMTLISTSAPPEPVKAAPAEGGDRYGRT